MRRTKMGLTMAMLAVSALAPGVALADDPNDPAMRSAAARARDRAMVQRLNEDQLAYVRQRDAQYAQEWSASRGDGASAGGYRAAQRQYERDLARWRHAVAQCQAGNVAYCAR